MLRRNLILLMLFACMICRSQKLYFPPLTGTAWETVTPASMGWCNEKMDELNSFLQQEGTKAFIVLKDGKIVMEKYFGTFTRDSIWYWASAGKSLTSFLIGQAQEDKLLSISDKTSKYLGKGWTGCTPEQEDKITIRHQLTMTTGLDDGVADNHCTLDTCLKYLAEPGARWAYHNAPYTLLENVLQNSTGQKINAFTYSKVSSRTGMKGLWYMLNYDNVFFSNARTFARYGLLVLNRGIWDNDTLLHDTAYFRQMVNTSQNLNKSYGYLWWLNGMESFMVPTLQKVFPGSYAPDAPSDMFAALGKNAQILSISPSKGIIIVRMGNQPSSPASEAPLIFCSQIWEKINNMSCSTSVIESKGNNTDECRIAYNPLYEMISISFNGNGKFKAEIYNSSGIKVMSRQNAESIDISVLPRGIYILKVMHGNGSMQRKIVKI